MPSAPALCNWTADCNTAPSSLRGSPASAPILTTYDNLASEMELDLLTYLPHPLVHHPKSPFARQALPTGQQP